jgi:hypothetical protein
MLDRPVYADLILRRLETNPVVSLLGPRQVGKTTFGFEFKHADAPSLTKSMHIARQNLKLERLLIVTPGRQSYPLADWAEVVGITELMPRLGQLLAAPQP